MNKGAVHINYWTDYKKEKFPKTMVLLFFLLANMSSFGKNTSSKIGFETSKVSVALPNPHPNSVKRIPDSKEVADSLILRSTSYIQNGQLSEASRLVERSLELYRLLSEYKGIGKCHAKIASIFYYQGKYAEALSAYGKSVTAYRKIRYNKGIASAFNNQGAVYNMLGNYPKALDYYKQAASLNETFADKKQTASTIQNIGGIYLELNDYRNAMLYFKKAKRVYESISDKKTLSQVLIAIGEVHMKQKNYLIAIEHYEGALNLANEVQDQQRILEATYKMGEIFNLQNKYQKAFTFFNRSEGLAKQIKNTMYQSRSLTAIGSTYLKLGEKSKAITSCKQGLKIAKTIKTISPQVRACQCLYEAYKSRNQAVQALTFYEQSILLKDSLRGRQTADALLNMEFENQMLLDSLAQVEKETKLQIRHEREVAEKEQQRNSLIVSGCFVLVLAGGLWSRLNYTKKSRARLQIEKDRSEHLLLNILPEEIAEELKEKGYVDAQDFETASILFTDFKSFTETAAKLTPQELVEEINVCFKAFDAIMDRYNIEKIKTIGDAYMAAGGLPKPDGKAVKNTILAALDMQAFISKRKLENDAQGKPAFEMRIGIHVGPIVAGIVGVKKFQYDIWGDTVNTASRMESNGAVGEVNISCDTYLLVKEERDLVFKYRGEIAAKGKGDLEMYFVQKLDTIIRE